ncbi:hypothetical protein ROJ8625_02363 [Roseivivax jejudonensis]|uniref:Uncharacterized protein n=1 Tax=Roseivivax jejudonensis TaxID=1529041 RepID=A0A1X6ZFQ3_9RHOB|nr:hypothetical protein [Roseivivax jejudonensis]SLN48518.1 hypothetical protein ROJ8625_02363 [Roseivivax jejudonensis]
MTTRTPTTLQPEETRPDAPRQPGTAEDLRGRTTTRGDLSEHRRFAWLYEDLLA